MTYLFYARLIGLTAGTLAYLFLLALILGHRRPRFFERLLFFLILGRFCFYAGQLLFAATLIYAPSGARSEAAPLLYNFLQAVGVLLIFPLVWQGHYSYQRDVFRSSPVAGHWSGYFARPLLVVFYLITAAILIAGVMAFWQSPNTAVTERVFLMLVTWGVGGEPLVIVALCDSVFELQAWRAAKSSIERGMFCALFVSSSLIAMFLVGAAWWRGTGGFGSVGFVTGAAVAGVLPGAILIYYSLRRNFLEYGAQRNLVYALSSTFLALLYLALVRRISGWLEPALPPEATASILLFVLIFLFEPLERVIGPALHRAHQERFGRVQKLAVELQAEARNGDIAELIGFAGQRIREEFGLAVVRLSVPRDPGVAALESLGGLGHVARLPLKKDGNEIGLLEAASTGSYLTGETSAALEFLAEQLPASIDLCRLIGEKVQLERELAERERMAGLGQMAATISHNLRNPLSSMKTVLQVQLENPDLPIDARRDCSLVVNEIDRMSAKLTQLLRYAKPSVNGERVAAVALARQTASLFGRDAEQRNIRLEFDQARGEISVLGSEEALGEVVSNLIVNAMEAQPNGGRIRVGPSKNGEFAEIRVDDDGPGISEELRAKIFQPYFTTKATGRGLGLSIVARRIAEMGGTLICESPLRNGAGTRFRLTVPLAKGEAS